MPKVIGDGCVYHYDKSKPRARCRKWQLRVCVEDAFGNQSKATRLVTGSYKEAKAQLDEFIAELKSRDTVDSSITVREYGEQWVSNREALPRYAKRTTDGERSKLKSINKHIGDMKLSDVNAKAINELYVRLRNGESVSGRPLSGTSLRCIHKTLTTMLRQAIYEDHLLDPKALIGIVVPEIDTEERVPLTNSQVEAFTAELMPHSAMEMAALIYVTCGLRRSEAVALNWMDLDDGVIHVRKSAEEDATIKKTKQRASNRAVPMPKITREKLAQWKDFQKILLENHGVKQTGKTPVISNDGKRIRPNNITSWWKKHREIDYDIECTLHDLRHTYSTMLARKSVHIRVAQRLVGDKSLEVLMQVYTHVADDDMRIAVEKLDDIFE